MNIRRASQSVESLLKRAEPKRGPRCENGMTRKHASYRRTARLLRAAQQVAT